MSLMLRPLEEKDVDRSGEEEARDTIPSPPPDFELGESELVWTLPPNFDSEAMPCGR